MRRFKSHLVVMLCLAGLVGCAKPVEQRKEAVAIKDVPADLLKLAKRNYPNYNFQSAFADVEGGQKVYKLMGKTKTGKIMELAITEQGEILK
jgi:hypothetical protein